MQKYFQIWQADSDSKNAKRSHSGKVTVTLASTDEPKETQGTDNQPEDEPVTGQMDGFPEEDKPAGGGASPGHATSGTKTPSVDEEEGKKGMTVEYEGAGIVIPYTFSMTHLPDQDTNQLGPQVLITYGSTQIHAFLLDDWLATQPGAGQITSQLQSGTPFWVNMPPTFLPESIGSIFPVFPVFQVSKGGVRTSETGQITIIAELLACHNCGCTECSNENSSNDYHCLNCNCCTEQQSSGATPGKPCKAKKVRVIITLSADNTQISSVNLQTNSHLTSIALSDTPFEESQNLSHDITLIGILIASLSLNSQSKCKKD